LVSATVGGAPLDDTARYTVATNDFMARGGDGYDMLKDGKLLIDGLAGQYMAGQVIAYIQKAGRVAPRVGRQVAAEALSETRRPSSRSCGSIWLRSVGAAPPHECLAPQQRFPPERLL
jgi:hypothetical protein